MENKQYHLVSRNNYFLGKLMTARDFFAEQDYMNYRRRLGNRFMSGVGIVAGLNIFLVDDKSFSLEPGFAIDYYGREIVVGQARVRKLNLIKGFEELKDESVIYLCIRYKESFEESTFSVTSSSSSESERQFNRIREKFELFLTKEEPQELDLKVDGLLFQKVYIYDENGIKIWGMFPKYVNPNKKVKIKIFFEKNKVGDSVSFKFNISGILFKDSATVFFEETEISDYGSTIKECYLFCNATHDAISEIIIAKDNFNLKIGSESFGISKDIEININVKSENIKDLIISDYYSINFDKLIEDNDEKFVYLAKIHVLRDGLNYIIEKFDKYPAEQFLLSNDLLRLIHEVDDEHTSENEGENKLKKDSEAKEDNDTNTVEKLIEKDNITTGVETINFGFKPKPGKVYYSYEFVHGLGPGNIGVITSIVNDENSDFEEKNLLIFGDRSIFGVDEANISVPDVQIASIVDPEKGTMRIGVRLEERTNVQMVKIRWWAMRPIENESARDELIIDDDLKIVVSPDSVTVKPLEQIRFSAKIIGTEDQRISWELVKNNPGKIDANGLYTAPATEGIFEIIAQAANFENLKASAYVVVTTESHN